MGENVKNEGTNVYIYTRVSTAIQVDGYSLDAQQEDIRAYAAYQKMQIKGVYSDEGKSGKSIIGREAFQQMMEDIENRKDNVSFVLVFKLSRFGRNAADVLSSLKTMNRYGVHLICVKDNIDSSMDSGKLMISILSAMAEIERDNILVQTMAGRREKARKGLFNGGVPPYGYKSVDGVLQIQEDEAEVVRMIFDEYIHTEKGFPSIANWLNSLGYKKHKRGKNDDIYFSASNIAKIIDNEIYTGKMVYGRTTTVPKEDNPDQYHRIKAKEYLIAEGQHEAIISDEIWEAARIKRKETGGRKDKIEQEHEYILSGIVRCPICGHSLYGVPMRGRKKKDGTSYPTYYAYMCRHREPSEKGYITCKFGQVGCNKIDDPVKEIILSIVENVEFQDHLSELTGSAVDTLEVERLLEQAIKQVRQAVKLQHRLEEQLDSLDMMDKHYERMFESLTRRLQDTFEVIDIAERKRADAEARLEAIHQQNLTKESIISVLRLFSQIYDNMSDKEKKNFMQMFIRSIDLYPEKTRRNGCGIKTIHFRFPVSYKGEKVVDYKVSPPNNSMSETVVLMSRKDKEREGVF